MTQKDQTYMNWLDFWQCHSDKLKSQELSVMRWLEKTLCVKNDKFYIIWNLNHQSQFKWIFRLTRESKHTLLSIIHVCNVRWFLFNNFQDWYNFSTFDSLSLAPETHHQWQSTRTVPRHYQDDAGWFPEAPPKHSGPGGAHKWSPATNAWKVQIRQNSQSSLQELIIKLLDLF